MSKSRIVGVDATIKKEFYSIEEMRAICNKHFKEWAFQLEKGTETGYEHWQLRGKLNEKQQIDKDNHLNKVCKGWFSPTTTAMVGNYDYCTKDHTREIGPFRWDDKVLTRQVSDFLQLELRPYQRDVERWCKEPDDRTIDVIFDEVGNVGKSIFAEYLEYKGYCENVPAFRAMEDIMGWVCTRPIAPMYIFDMPRGMKKDKLADFYSGIECIKNGMAYDKRYNARKIYFDRPRVVVFTNTLPKYELLSKDRWHTWRMREDFSIDLIVNVFDIKVDLGSTES